MGSNNQIDRYVLIMAGGIGSRFWPKSRNDFPKQFIDILGTGKSLLQMTFERFKNICPAENIFILTNEEYSPLVLQQLPALSIANIIAEPTRNNTAPCIAYASFKIAGLNPNARIVVAPSDHLILDEYLFVKQINQCLEFTSVNDALVTLGIRPTRPDTGYGYINYDNDNQNDIYPVRRFLEKPDLETAKSFLEDGGYLWNAGIFIWNVKSILKALEIYAKEIYELFKIGAMYYNTDEEKAFIQENYPLSPNISIDYAIMEHAQNVYTLPGTFGWSDLGTWASLHEVLEKDDKGNVFSGGAVVLRDTDNCIIQLPKGKSSVIKGLSNYIVVDDGKSLLIYPKADEQEIKIASQSV